MNKKTVLIAGGCGFIGTNLVKKLLKSNFIVHNIDKMSYCSTPVRFTGIKKNRNYFFHKFDLCNQKKVESLIKKIKPSFVVNLAAESHVDRSIDSPKKFFINNVSSTLNILEAIRNNFQNSKINKIIHISTDEVYGGEIKIPSKEEDRYITNSPYSASKASTDHLCNSYRKTFNLPIVILNCCNNFGPFQFPEKLIPTIINCLRKNNKIPLYGNGKNVREWIYVDDFCEAIK